MVIMVEAKVNVVKSLCGIDTGASVSLLGQSQWKLTKVDSKVVLSPVDIVTEAANSSPIAIFGKVILPVENFLRRICCCTCIKGIFLYCY